MAEPREESRSNASTGAAVARRETPSTGISARPASPFGLLQEMSNQMSRLFSDFPFARDGGGMGTDEGMWTPQVDVLRRGDNLVVRADLPGLSKENVSVDVTDNALTIRGQRQEEKKEEREGYYWHERSEGSFHRSIPLPEGADPERADARMENGVLEVTVPAPKMEEPRGRRVEIR